MTETLRDTAGHWDDVFHTHPVDQVSWFQGTADTSLRLLRGPDGDLPGSLVDVGAGTSRLVDQVLDEGRCEITLLDVSEEALAVTRERLDGQDERVSYVVGDVLRWTPVRRYDAWHDRATLHFLTEPTDRAAYVDLAARTVRPGGVVVIGGFAPDGPTHCSGLVVARRGAAELAGEFAAHFDLDRQERESHRTPEGVEQPFTWVRLRRRDRDRARRLAATAEEQR